MEPPAAKGETVIVIRPSRFRLRYIRPCMTDRQKRMAEVILNTGKMDPCSMCDILSSHFTSVGCSPELGIARVQEGEKIIMVFDSGKVVIRQARDEEDILMTAERLADIFLRGKAAGISEGHRNGDSV